MQKIEKKPHSYVHIVCEMKLNLTEDRTSIEKILQKFLVGDIEVDERFDGTYLLIRAEGSEHLTIFHEWIATQRIIDTVRTRLFRSIVNNVTAVYFNRAAAYMDHLSLVDHDDNIPLGPVAFQIVSDNLEEIIELVAPKTFEGRIATPEEIQRIQAKRERRKTMKEKAKKRSAQRDEKYIDKFS